MPKLPFCISFSPGSFLRTIWELLLSLVEWKEAHQAGNVLVAGRMWASTIPSEHKNWRLSQCIVVSSHRRHFNSHLGAVIDIRCAPIDTRYYGLVTATDWPYERSCLSDSECQFGKQCSGARKWSLRHLYKRIYCKRRGLMNGQRLIHASLWHLLLAFSWKVSLRQAMLVQGFSLRRGSRGEYPKVASNLRGTCE